MGEAGYGTAMYGEDTETHEVDHSDLAGDEEDEFGYDEEPDDSEAYNETGEDFFDPDADI